MRVIGALSKDRIQPFALNRSGTELADGVGVLVLESREWAERRSAVVYASVAGYGIRSDAYNISAPDPEGAALEKAMRSAIAMSGIDPDQVGYINAHGSGTPLNDELETRIIRKVFGGHAGKLLINSSKSIIGHTLGAAGVIESVITVLALVHGRVHATANYTDADPDCDLNYCTNGYVDADLRFAMSNSIGFGGTNVCIVFEKGGACDEA
ncbi:3-oxoacyl-[acyl-carrier-protein] synthase 2 [compost metagenome]